MEPRTIVVRGLLVRYIDTGVGETLLLLHGWGSSLATFQKLSNELQWKGRVVALDLPGFGGSEVPKEAWDVHEYARFVREFLNALKIEEPSVMVGHSLGGRISIKAVSESLIHPKHVVLIASAGLAKRGGAKNVAFRALAKVGKTLTSVPPFSIFKTQLKRSLYEMAGSSDYLNAGAMRETFKKVIQENLKTDAEQITVPTLLVWGEKDQVTPQSEARDMLHAIKNSKLDLVPECGHFVHEEAPRRVAESIATFVA